jgi:hypothetical protein
MPLGNPNCHWAISSFPIAFLALAIAFEPVQIRCHTSQTTPRKME